jgi:hypothetical protein
MGANWEHNALYSSVLFWVTGSSVGDQWCNWSASVSVHASFAGTGPLQAAGAAVCSRVCATDGDPGLLVLPVS